MDFYTWMKRYRGEDSPMGDLAGDMERDDEWPRFRGKPTPKDKRIAFFHLKHRNACHECTETFEEAWEEYMKEEAVKATAKA